jgi:beta-lactam-binding protein with PASTA domain
MEKHPDDRYESAADMADDLKRVLAGQVPLAAHNDEAATRILSATPQPPPYDDPYAPPPPPRRRQSAPARGGGGNDRTPIIVGVLAAAGLLGLGLILLIRLLGSASPDGSITIPDVRGMELSVARAEIDALGLTRAGEQVVADTEIPVGLAAGTDPAAGERVDPGAEVIILVSGGVADIAVPRVIELTLDAARSQIEGLGLEVGEVTYEVSTVIPEGSVIGQAPEPGTLVARGTDVDLVVSAGADALVVPDLAGRTESQALFALTEAGFDSSQIVIERRPSGDIEEGFVIETEPPAGEILPPGGTVVLVVSLGATPAVVPNVVGMTPEEAQSRLEDFGFEVAFDDDVELEWDDPLDGNIAEQDPAAGQTLEFGATVTLRIGRAATEVPVPAVVGDSESAARAEVEAAGFVWARGGDTVLPPGDSNIGRVVSQDPTAGSIRSVGSTVTVSIGVEGAIVPNLFTGGTGGCANAVTQSTAQSRIASANLSMITGSPVDEYSYSEAPGQNTHACEGRTVEQSPPPGTLVAKNSTVTVVFDIVRAPLDFEIYELLPEDAVTTFSVFFLELNETDGGLCRDPDPEYSGKIRMIEPLPEEEIPLVDGQYRLEYWVATTASGSHPDCPDYDPPPPD